MAVYDCFTFRNELDLLEMRLNILDEKVDYFVLAESNKTHSGTNKDLFFNLNKERFSKFSKKIIHIIVDDMPELKDGNRWVLENFQRNAIMRGLSNCKDDDIILVSDLDEIANLEKLEEIKVELIHKASAKDTAYHIYRKLKEIFGTNALARKILHKFPIKSKRLASFKQNVYYYYLNGFINADWIGTKVVLFKNLVGNYNSSPQEIREVSSKTVIQEGGWHFSYLLSPEEIAIKIKAFAHSEFDKKEYTDVDAIKKRISEGEDLFGRKEKITYVSIDEKYPKWLLDNRDKYKNYINL